MVPLGSYMVPSVSLWVPLGYYMDPLKQMGNCAILYIPNYLWFQNFCP